MAQPTKPPVTSVWASAATDNVTPTDSFIAAGWPLSTTPPSRGRFNWLLNYLYNGVRYFSRRGIADYDAAETYMTNDKTMGADGLTYISLVDNNIGNAPPSSPAKWQRWGFSHSQIANTAPVIAKSVLGSLGASGSWQVTATITAPCAGFVYATGTVNAAAQFTGVLAMNLNINGSPVAGDTTLTSQTQYGQIAVTAGQVINVQVAVTSGPTAPGQSASIIASAIFSPAP